MNRLEQIKIVRKLASEKQWMTARKQFDKLKPEDFSDIDNFKMSHGIIADVKSWFFYVDHDWYDSEWCLKFLDDMIYHLETRK